MGKVIKFFDHVISEQPLTTVGDLHRMRLMSRWYFNNRRLMQEAADKRKREEESQDG